MPWHIHVCTCKSSVRLDFDINAADNEPFRGFIPSVLNGSSVFSSVSRLYDD